MSNSRDGPLWGRRENIRWLLLRGFLGGITIISFFAALTVRGTSASETRIPGGIGLTRPRELITTQNYSPSLIAPGDLAW
jgi:hypothetical protein